MSDILEMFRKTLEVEGELLNTPDSCTINRALELAANAYQLGNQQSDEGKLREQYAGLAMQAIIGNSDDSIFQHKEEAMKEAIEFADALIAELKKGGVKE